MSFVGCDKQPDITDDLLDGDVIFDASLYTPENFLVSAKYPNPSADDLDRHVIIAAHGYSASTFEWQEFADWSAQNQERYRVSQVLLGGHGRTYEEFKNSSWEDWKSAITEEYEKLEELGYTKISFVGSSTGGPLFLELLSSDFFNSHIHPKNVFLIDPIVVSSVKLQSIAGIVGPMLGYIETEQTAEENKYWYRFRPQETVTELNTLMKIVRKKLEQGFSLPSGTYLKSYHAKNDPVASSASTVLIYKGLKNDNGTDIEVEIMNSEIHVFTRLALRGSVSTLEKENQEHAFMEMSIRLN